MADPAETTRPEGSGARGGAAGPPPVRVLLVEDDDDDYALTRELLAEVGGGYSLERAATYGDGLEAMRQGRHDVYLLDYRLGGRTGVELMREAAAQGCRGPVILLTGQGERVVDLEAMRAGAEDFLAKDRLDAPLLERSLRYALERWRDRQALLHAHAELERRVEQRTAELAQANADLRASEERLRSVVNNLIDGIITIDEHGVVQSLNPAAERIFGYPAGEVVGRNVKRLMPEPYHSQHDGYIDHYLRTGQAKIIGGGREVFGRRKDGSTFPMDLAVGEFHLGRERYFTGVVRDITERRRVEQGLRFLADTSATLAALVDYESTLRHVARLAVPQFADWCAVDMAEADGSLRRLAVAHVDPAKVQLAHELVRRYPPEPESPRGPPQVLRTGRPDMMEDIPEALIAGVARDDEHRRLLRELGLRSYMCVPLPGRTRLLGVISFVSAESGRRYTPADLAFAEELARRAAIAIENARLYAELREADRLKDEFLAMLAHELRNPLAPIRNALHILKQPAVSGAVVQQARDMAERQVQHMARLLDDLLDMARISRGRIELRKEALDLRAVANRSVEAVRPLYEQRQHELTVSLPPEPVRVEADPTRLEQILTNLLNNAAKYTDPGGRVLLAVGREGAEAVLRVRDTGIGIAPDMLPRVFDLFVQAERRLDRAQGGVGIGLSLVRQLVGLHGGTIEAESRGLGQGSEFIVRLPALADDRGGREGQQRPSAPAALPPHRVLVVDDNVDAADSLAVLLRLAGQDVRVAYEGAQALALAQEFCPQAVFLDIGMPGMDGYEVCRRLRQQPGSAAALLVALTGWGQDEDRRRACEAGFDHHAVKPIEPEALRQLLAPLALPGTKSRHPG